MGNKKTEDLNKEEYKITFSMESLESELKREKYKSAFMKTMRNTIYSLIVVAALAVIVAVMVLPVLQITGNSMMNNLKDGDVVVAFRGGGYEPGDIIAFYYSNDILVKRVIAESGDWVDMDEDGNVYVNSVQLEESYVFEKEVGECDIDFPYQVPEGKVFVMGDHRSVSLDSRTAAIGCISDEQVIGRVLFRAWPFSKFGGID